METNSTKKFEEALQLLNEAARDKKTEIKNLLGDKYSEISDLIHDDLSQRRKAVRQVKQKAEDLLDEGNETIREAKSKIEDSVRENPLPYIGALAVGTIVLGFILGSSSRNK